MARTRRGDESNSEENQEQTTQEADQETQPTGSTAPQESSNPSRDYGFSASNGVFTCKACQQTKHTDPVKGKELCPVADTNCPRNS